MIDLTYTQFKSLIDAGSIRYKHVELENKYVLFGFDDLFECKTEIFKDTDETSESTDYELNYAGNNNKLSNISVLQHAQPVIIHKQEEESFARATHDFCNKTTWYSNSVRVEGEILSDPVGLVYTCANTVLIDVLNGNVNRQDTLQEYAIKVYDGGIPKTDFTVEHTTGKITLLTAASGELTVDYSYPTDSEWVMKPNVGKMLLIEHSEIQFSTDVSVNSPLRFEIWVSNPYYAVEGHPYEGMEKITYQTVQYNSIKDFVNEANLGTGVIPAIGNLPECAVFPFNYASIKPFKYSQGAELRIRSVDDVELEGSFGTATFYIVKRDE